MYMHCIVMIIHRNGIIFSTRITQEIKLIHSTGKLGFCMRFLDLTLPVHEAGLTNESNH